MNATTITAAVNTVLVAPDESVIDCQVRVVLTVGAGVGFKMLGAKHHTDAVTRETRERVRAGLLSVGAGWPDVFITVAVITPL